jgi:PAS domain-containing protein
MTMLPTEPLPLHHSWPILDDAGWMGHGCLLESAPPPPDAALLATMTADGLGVGKWSCDLADNRIEWSDTVYDLFGLPRGSPVARAESVRRYAEPSRAAMERLRAYAIRHRRGFTLDVEIVPPGLAPRWMRLLAAPVCVDGEVVRLTGIKRDVTALYR